MAFQNTFAGNPLDRAGDLRNDPDWIAEQAAKPYAQAMILWEGRPLIEEGPDGPRLAWVSMPHARDLVRDRALFMGLWKDEPAFAVEFEGSLDPAEGPVRGLGVFHEMRAAAAVLPAGDAAMAGGAKSLFDWRRRHGFCANCGGLTQTASGGWKRVCPACGAEHFPRVDPVTIMLPVYEGGTEPVCLVGRQAAWPAGRMSALAGFLEPGETIEEACAREVKEEAGLTVVSTVYHSSQPWPFPSQLMIGLIAQVSDDQARPDQTELEAVAWLTRAEARAVIAGDHTTIQAPPPFAIAHNLIKAWAEAG
ncbi:NAD(+) diphosphatase [Brevundimonas sp. SORGH_AS_0993]|uniref:NAD(+) diphosphatase n=1 Tax=Brevundimonas sp. SORGH_AS_0993 TaxID=3041794 RepID=UPI00278A27EF|nr:NAD(+) diphosphatase [Brevundimonas sp. SORGH_AS_0993]MDQ1154555.1 NAD+ diphosphatase [Brevundimonas sp. SORGH_AS_0993]